MPEVRLTRNFLSVLDALELYAAGQGDMRVYGRLLDMLETTVIPTLETFPEYGRWFFERSQVSSKEIEHVATALVGIDIKPEDVREFVLGEFSILYGLKAGDILLLAIKHHRQVSFSLADLT